MVTGNDISLLTIAEAAHLVGIRERTLRVWIVRYQLPISRLNDGRVLISERAILDCERSRRRETRGRKAQP